jgi:Yip1 domain
MQCVPATAVRKRLRRAANLILRPDGEWDAIARDAAGLRAEFFGYLLPLAAISPLAHGTRVLLGGDGAIRRFAEFGEALHYVCWSAAGGLIGSLLSVLMLALAIFLLAPLYGGQRSYGNAVRVVMYAGTPVWLAGVVLLAPLTKFPLLVIIILLALMHGLFLFYLGLYKVMKVPQRDAAECTAIVLMAGILFSTVAGYCASAAGLFPRL